MEVEFGNFGKDEIGIGIGQSFELGGKKRTRIEIAKIELEKSELEFDIKKFELEIEAIRRVLPLLSNTTKLTLLDSIIAIAESTLKTIQKRVDAGTTMPTDAIRAEMELEELLLERRLADREVVQLKKNLSVLWSSSTIDFSSISGTINQKFTIPSLETFQKSLLNHPEIKMIELEWRLSQKELEESRIGAIPDLTISAGFTRSMETEENTVALSASIDLPIFSRNQGEIKSKEYSADAFQLDADNTILIKQTELQKLYNRLRTVDEKLNTIETKILPKAESVFQTLLGYYELGSVGLLDVIEVLSELLDYNTSIIDNYVIRTELLTDLYELTGHKMKFIVNE